MNQAHRCHLGYDSHRSAWNTLCAFFKENVEVEESQRFQFRLFLDSVLPKLWTSALWTVSRRDAALC